MIRAITIAYRHDGNPVILADPSKALHEQKSEFKKLTVDREHEEFSRIEVWTSSSGVTKSRRFEKSAPADESETEGKKPSKPKKKR